MSHLKQKCSSSSDVRLFAGRRLPPEPIQITLLCSGALHSHASIYYSQKSGLIPAELLLRKDNTMGKYKTRAKENILFYKNINHHSLPAGLYRGGLQRDFRLWPGHVRCQGDETNNLWYESFRNWRTKILGIIFNFHDFSFGNSQEFLFLGRWKCAAKFSR